MEFTCPVCGGHKLYRTVEGVKIQQLVEFEAYTDKDKQEHMVVPYDVESWDGHVTEYYCADCSYTVPLHKNLDGSEGIVGWIKEQEKLKNEKLHR